MHRDIKPENLLISPGVSISRCYCQQLWRKDHAVPSCSWQITTLRQEFEDLHVQRAFGYIRCDRVKGPVRFQADGFKRAPRVGEKVRFKGRHGAMRKPVAVVVERAG